MRAVNFFQEIFGHCPKIKPQNTQSTKRPSRWVFSKNDTTDKPERKTELKRERTERPEFPRVRAGNSRQYRDPQEREKGGGSALHQTEKNCRTAREIGQRHKNRRERDYRTAQNQREKENAVRERSLPLQRNRERRQRKRTAGLV